MDVYYLLVADLVCPIESAIAESIETVEYLQVTIKFVQNTSQGNEIYTGSTTDNKYKRTFVRCEKIEVLLSSLRWGREVGD